uniref:Uncharacterized protein n=1 Tax=Cacopsylla melanoneura TaxID=428564 RepID=A0A8D9E8G0_9HEMI
MLLLISPWIPGKIHFWPNRTRIPLLSSISRHRCNKKYFCSYDVGTCIVANTSTICFPLCGHTHFDIQKPIWPLTPICFAMYGHTHFNIQKPIFQMSPIFCSGAKLAIDLPCPN